MVILESASLWVSLDGVCVFTDGVRVWMEFRTRITSDNGSLKGPWHAKEQSSHLVYAQNKQPVKIWIQLVVTVAR